MNIKIPALSFIKLMFHKFLSQRVNILLTIVLFYILIAIYQISYPGLQYDEVLFSNVALKVIDPSTFVYSRFAGIPIMVMAYIGALKSYLYLPIFALFGTSVWTVRLPVILLTALGLFLLGIVIKKKYGWKVSLISLLLLVLNPAFISLTRADVGPIVIEVFLKIIAIGVGLKMIQTLKEKTKGNSTRQLLLWTALLSFVFTLGVFNKINFIWFVNAFVGAGIFAYWKDIFAFIREKKAFLASGIISVLIAIPYALFAYISIKGNAFGLIPAPYDPINSFRNILLALSGIGFIDIVYVRVSPILYVPLGLLMLLLFVIAFVKAFRQREDFTIFLGGIVLLSLAQIFLTKNAQALWHSFIIFPMVMIVIATYFNDIKMQIRQIHLKGVFLGGILTVYSMLSLYQLSIITQEPYSVVWSPKIYDLVEETKAHDFSYISLDWAIHTQLLTLNPVEGKYREDFWTINTLEEKELGQFVLDRYITDDQWKNQRFIVFTQTEDIRTVTSLREELNKKGFDLVIEKRIPQQDSTYTVSKITQVTY